MPFNSTVWHREWRKNNRTKVRASENKWRAKSVSYRRKMRSYAKSYRPIRNQKRELPLTRYQYSLQLAAQRKKSWSINFDLYSELIQKPCHYCFGNAAKYGVGLDRKDSGKGYDLDNVVPCCGPCNMIKGKNLTYDEMVVAMQAVNRYRKEGKCDEK